MDPIAPTLDDDGVMDFVAAGLVVGGFLLLDAAGVHVDRDVFTSALTWGLFI